MEEPQVALIKIADDLSALLYKIKSTPFEEQLKLVAENALELEKCWSGSYFGYHSRVYYKDFNKPPAGARFSVEWGLMDTMHSQATTGKWIEYDFQDVKEEICRRSNNTDPEQFRVLSAECSEAFEAAKSDVLSVLHSLNPISDAFLESIRVKVDELQMFSKAELTSSVVTPAAITRDTTALSQGAKLSPHKSVFFDVKTLLAPVFLCHELEKLSRRAGSHILRVQRNQIQSKIVGTNVFIGHGRSHDWRELKDFIHDRLCLPFDEFNRVPVAGVTNIERLSQMLDSSAIALLVMTAEDEQADGGLRARMNVIHEAGLFQGRLGFSKAILLLEEGCEEFSNIQGLGQIRFPKGNIRATFEEVRRVVERENLT